jgi:diaminohydroxyphosphoribosylaminopyrimidine deaminase/5-amino-6-(5-phosphoribosylamino)uracil reductase
MDHLDEMFMREALKLARRGMGWTSPNPMVGAVLVKEGRVISKGYHRRFGGPHAEVEALSRAEGELDSATLYVNLEPCSHYGKTPPCAHLIAQRGVGRVVVGTMDPNPEVAGKGIHVLRDRGIRVDVGCLEGACRELNRAYFHWREHGLPWVTLKWAQSIDGRIAASSGDSKWISSERSRARAHRLRALHDAVMVGVETVIRDDPRLTVRLARGRDPKRIVIDSLLRIPPDSRVLEGCREDSVVWVAATTRADQRRAQMLKEAGVKVLLFPPDDEGRVPIEDLLRVLAREEISSLLVEGGAEVLTSFFKLGCFQEIVVFIAPKILGEGISAVGNLGIEEVRCAVSLQGCRWERSGEDLVLRCRRRGGPA